MNLFYEPQLTFPQTVLSREESQHCVKVLRMQKGQEIYLTDGHGNMYESTLAVPDANACVIQIGRRIEGYGSRSYSLQIAVAPTKNMERYEWFVEKATEMGVDQIIPLICEHSERKICKTDRCERIAVSALKQCKRAQLPQIRQPLSFSDFIKEENPAQVKAIACCWVDTPRIPLVTLLKQAATTALSGESPVPLSLLIGPEGDFSKEEVALAQSAGYLAVDLGSSILRTETAALMACAQCASLFPIPCSSSTLVAEMTSR